MDRLIDTFAREINCLRISVTDRCNLRCVYCMPAEGVFHRRSSEILSFEEICRIVKISASLGIKKIRITGGEPLVRRGLPTLIGALKRIEGIEEIALTTNGIFLSGLAHILKKVGLDRINVSLDSLDTDKFKDVTRGGILSSVLRGISSAMGEGFSDIKINTVLLKNFNEDEIQDFALLTKSTPIQVRFIEYMPTGLLHISSEESYRDDIFGSDPFFSCVEAKDICEKIGRLLPAGEKGSQTAKAYRLEGFLGTVAFISPVSEPFCASCNKLRLTSDGCLRSCLHSSNSVDLKKAVSGGASDEELTMLIKKAVDLKPRSHNLSRQSLHGEALERFSMCQIGG